jgi:nickel/cobalt exporter
MGVAGGLVPSPSALIVLLSAIALGRTAFGVVLVIGYGVGMASMLTLAGLLLVRVRDRYRSRTSGSSARALGRIGRRWAVLAAPATATLVVIVGVGVAVRGLSLV